MRPPALASRRWFLRLSSRRRRPGRGRPARRRARGPASPCAAASGQVRDRAEVRRRRRCSQLDRFAEAELRNELDQRNREALSRNGLGEAVAEAVPWLFGRLDWCRTCRKAVSGRQSQHRGGYCAAAFGSGSGEGISNSLQSCHRGDRWRSWGPEPPPLGHCTWVRNSCRDGIVRAADKANP